MTNDTKPPALADIVSSKGMEFLNRAHSRSFTLYIFLGNTESLLRLSERTHRPNGIR